MTSYWVKSEIFGFGRSNFLEDFATEKLLYRVCDSCLCCGVWSKTIFADIGSFNLPLMREMISFVYWFWSETVIIVGSRKF